MRIRKGRNGIWHRKYNNYEMHLLPCIITNCKLEKMTLVKKIPPLKGFMFEITQNYKLEKDC